MTVVPLWPSVMTPLRADAGVMLAGDCCSTVAVGDAAVAHRGRSRFLWRRLLHRDPSVMPPSPTDAGVMFSGECCSAAVVGDAAVARRCRSLCSSDCCSAVAVGDAAVARRCRSHVFRRLLFCRGRR